MEDFREKRKHKRIDLSGYIKIKPININGDEKELKGKFKNISEGGILFESVSLIEKDTLLKIELTIPDNKAFAARYREFANVIGKKTMILGKVVRSIQVEENKWNLGIQFVNMYEGDFANFKRFLELIDKNYSW